MDRSINIINNKNIQLNIDPSVILLIIIGSIFSGKIPMMPENIIDRSIIITSFLIFTTFIRIITVKIIDDKLIKESFTLGIFGLSNTISTPNTLPDVLSENDYLTLYYSDTIKGHIYGHALIMLILSLIIYFSDNLKEINTNLLIWMSISLVLKILPIYGTLLSSFIISYYNNSIKCKLILYAISVSLSTISAIYFQLHKNIELASASILYSIMATVILCNLTIEHDKNI